jgi:hypothetical protein
MTMKNDKRSEYVARDTILKLLSDDEIASVSTAETQPRLAHGDEYLDLEQIDRGVQRADGIKVFMGRVVPRAAVQEGTWNKILAYLGPAPVTSYRMP